MQVQPGFCRRMMSMGMYMCDASGSFDLPREMKEKMAFKSTRAARRPASNLTRDIHMYVCIILLPSVSDEKGFRFICLAASKRKEKAMLSKERVVLLGTAFPSKNVLKQAKARRRANIEKFQ